MKVSKHGRVPDGGILRSLEPSMPESIYISVSGNPRFCINFWYDLSLNLDIYGSNIVHIPDVTYLFEIYLNILYTQLYMFHCPYMAYSQKGIKCCKGALDLSPVYIKVNIFGSESVKLDKDEGVYFQPR